MSNRKKITPAKPNPRNYMQAFFFVRSLSRITHTTAPFRKRCIAIRRAAYTSMACSASPRRAWRRALLYRVVLRGARPVRSRLTPYRNQQDGLRRLVPGGQAMDFCKLLEETIDYVRCLRTQVHLMQDMADSVEEDTA